MEVTTMKIYTRDNRNKISYKIFTPTTFSSRFRNTFMLVVDSEYKSEPEYIGNANFVFVFTLSLKRENRN